MILKINGTTQLDYDRIHQLVEEHTEPPHEHIANLIKDADWNQYDRGDFNLFDNWDQVTSYCGNDVLSWLDATSYSIMDLTTPSKTIYNFIHSRAEIVRNGVNKEGQNLVELKGQYWTESHEYVDGLKESFGENLADILNFIVMMFI